MSIKRDLNALREHEQLYSKIQMYNLEGGKRL